MSNADVSDLMFRFFILAVQIGGPVLIIPMLIAVLISILQAATQIHEQSLTFLPKLFVIAILLVLTGGSMLVSMQDYFTDLMETIAAL